jgi:CheY-like chemotaxis protein
LDERSDIGAVFTDINMPGSQDGLRLAHAILDRWPPIHLLVTSRLNAPRQEEFPGKACFLPKPYTPKQVLKAFDDLFSLKAKPLSISP